MSLQNKILYSMNLLRIDGIIIVIILIVIIIIIIIIITLLRLGIFIFGVFYLKIKLVKLEFEERHSFSKVKISCQLRGYSL